MKGFSLRRYVAIPLAACLLALLGLGATLIHPGTAHAAPCPTVDSTTGVVTPAPTPGVDWSNCDLKAADLSGADLSGANLSGADLFSSSLRGSTLVGADLTATDLSNADLEYANLSTAKLDNAAADYAYFSHADLSEATLADISALKADMAYANLTRSTLRGADFVGADFSSATLTETGFQRADLSKSKLTGAAITDAKLGTATLDGAKGCLLVGTPLALPGGWQVVKGCLTPPYKVSSFMSPVNSYPVVNKAAAGRKIPFLFVVWDGRAGDIVDGLKSVRVKTDPYRCSSALTTRFDRIEKYTSKPPGLKQLDSGYYRLVYETKKRWAGSCRSLLFDLGDGAWNGAEFRFDR